MPKNRPIDQDITMARAMDDGSMLDGMDEIFAIWIEKALVDRKKAVIKEAERLDKS